MNETIKVVIVDDHPGVRAGIKRLLVAAKDIIIIGEGNNGIEALQLAASHTPDVMLLDVEMPVLRGDKVLKTILDAQPNLKILAVSSYDDHMYIQGMMDNGALGYITKDEAPEMLVEAVRSIFKGGGIWLSPKAQKYYPR